MRRTALFAMMMTVGGVAMACGVSASSPESTGSGASALWSVSGSGDIEARNDSDDLRHNVVVSLSSTETGPSGCTGVLVTPRVVLTAASCASTAKVGTLPWVRIGAGNPAADASTATFRKAIKSEHVTTFAAAPANEPSLSGQDVALVFLPGYVLEDALIAHPTFKAPTPIDPTETLPGGQKRYASLGMAGWSGHWLDDVDHKPAVAMRQARVESQLLIWSYGVVGGGGEPFWVYKPFSDDGSPKFGLAAGDNGSPLFVETAAGEWDTFGIASIIGDPRDPAVRSQALPGLGARCAPVDATNGSVTSCDAWVDITATSVREWIRTAARDTSRGARWLAMHPRPASTRGGLTDGEWWVGDVDYTGACDHARDTDCDHIWDKNGDGTFRDNCTDWANTAQLDSDDNGVGDGCPCKPKSCAEQGKTCGTTTDTCGAPLSCGTCAAGSTCNAANVCVCAPTTCAAQGKDCGSIGDGCGGTLDCGGCSNVHQSCGGGGAANVCGCTPRDYDDVCDGTCGRRANGCGGTYFCGTCTGPGTGGPMTDCGSQRCPSTYCKLVKTSPSDHFGTYRCVYPTPI